MRQSLLLIQNTSLYFYGFIYSSLISFLINLFVFVSNSCSPAVIVFALMSGPMSSEFWLPHLPFSWLCSFNFAQILSWHADVMESVLSKQKENLSAFRSANSLSCSVPQHYCPASTHIKAFPFEPYQWGNKSNYNYRSSALAISRVNWASASPPSFSGCKVT